MEWTWSHRRLIIHVKEIHKGNVSNNILMEGHLLIPGRSFTNSTKQWRSFAHLLEKESTNFFLRP